MPDGTISAESAEKSASGFEKLVEKLPYAEGGLRRRLITGIIFLSIFISCILLGGGSSAAPIEALLSRLSDLQVDFGALLKSTQFTIALLFFVYAIGTVIDVTSESFIVRGIAAVSTLVTPWSTGGWRQRTLSVFVIAMWPISILAGFFRSTYRRTHLKLGFVPDPELNSENNNDLREELSHAAQFFCDRLAENVRAGLNEPFGGRFAAAWQAIIFMTPEPHKQWGVRLNARNHEMSSFLSGAFLGIASCAIHFVVTTKGGREWWGLVWFYLSLWITSYFFFGYLTVLRRSIASALEFLAFMNEKPLVVGECSKIIVSG